MAKEAVAPEETDGEAESPVVSTGQGAEEAPGNGQGEVWWKAPDGTAFKSPDELGKVYKDGLMMRSDYTKKTQAIAEERRMLEDERKRFGLEREERARIERERDAAAKKYEAFDRFVKQYPAKYKAWLAEIQKGPGPDDVAERVRQEMEEKYGSKLSEFEQWKAEQEATAKRNAAYETLKSKHKDFDGDAVDKRIAELTAKLREGDVSHLAEMIYLAGRPERRETPEMIDEEKKNAELLPGSGTATPTKAKPAKSLNEARERALRGHKE